MNNLVHLHLHTEYSVLDGATKIGELIERVAELEMGAVAVTDHGVMYGIYELFDKAANHNKEIEEKITALLVDKKKGANPQRIDEQVNKLIRQLVKPIAGVEGYLTFSQPGQNVPRYHIVLLAKTLRGYRNLCALVSRSHQEENFYRKPCITFDLLREYGEDIIVSSACIAGPVARPILDMELVRPSKKDEKDGRRVLGGMELSRKNAQMLSEAFPGRFYLELMLHPYSGEPRTNNVYPYQAYAAAALLLFAKEMNLPLLITNDAHFLRKGDADVQQMLVAIGTSKTMDDPKLLTYTHQEYVKSYDELREVFQNAYSEIAEDYLKLQQSEGVATPATLPEDEYMAMIDEGFTNSIKIAQQVATYSLLADPIMPDFPIPDPAFIEPVPANDTERRRWARKLREAYRYFEYLVYKGAKERWGDPLAPQYAERLEFELATIRRMRFPGYFLIVSDFLNYARQKGYPIGPGRGSAAGAAVSYCLGITNLDPLKYDLLFERFLNPDRISLPDIDVDIDDRSRGLIVEYLREKYGVEYVAGIATIGRSKIKNAINDVARVLATSDDVAAEVRAALARDEDEAKKKQKKCETLDNYLEHCSNLKYLVNKGRPEVKKFLSYVARIENSVRNIGQHACGYVISKVPLYSYVPTTRLAKADGILIQYESKVIESVGLVKMDLLGLRTLQIIDRTIKQIQDHDGVLIDVDDLPMEDTKTLELFGNAETKEVFQFESDGMRNYLKALKPSSIEDLVAMNALYRPGPLAQIPTYIKRKLGQEPVDYDIPEMESILKPTYGVTVYQEQVMRLSRLLAGFTPGQADKLRKAIGKKQEDVMEEMKGKFIKGAMAKGHPEQILVKIWDEWKEFAKYAFNRSHSACYAYVAYQSGYLKAHYPCEYVAACLQAETESKKLQVLGKECVRMGITILPPDINRAKAEFSVEDKKIRYGLARIKGMSEMAINAIIEEREKKGDFQDIYDLVERLPQDVLGYRIFELLAYSGALDSISPHGKRINLLHVIRRDSEGKPVRPLDEFIKYGKEYRKTLNEKGMFGRPDRDEVYCVPIYDLKPTEAQNLELLNEERKVLEMYLSAHPLDEYKYEIMYSADYSIANFESKKTELKGQMVTLAGMLTISDRGNKKSDKEKGTVESGEAAATAGGAEKKKEEKQPNAPKWIEVHLEDYSESIRLLVNAEKKADFKAGLVQNEKVLVTVKVEYNPVSGKYWTVVLNIEPLSVIRARGVKNFNLQIESNSVPEDLMELRRILQNSMGTTPLTIELHDVESNRTLIRPSSYKKINVNAQLIEQLIFRNQIFKINDRLFQQNLFNVVSNDESDEEIEEDLEESAPID